MPHRYNVSETSQARSRKLLWLCFFLFLQPSTWAKAPVAHAAILFQNNLELNDSTSGNPALPEQEVALNKRGFARTAALAGAWTGAFAATYILADEPLQRFSQSKRNLASEAVARTVDPLGKSGHLVPVAGVAALGGLIFKDAQLQKAGFVAMGSVMASAVVTNTLKQSFQRHRPSSTTENHHFDGFAKGENTSLPSAHASTAFAMATSVAIVYKDNKWVPPLVYSAATVVGLARIHDNVHWATDVIAGAAVGYFTSRGVNRIYDVVNQKLASRKPRLLLAPQVGLQSGTLSATLIF